MTLWESANHSNKSVIGTQQYQILRYIFNSVIVTICIATYIVIPLAS